MRRRSMRVWPLVLSFAVTCLLVMFNQACGRISFNEISSALAPKLSGGNGDGYGGKPTVDGISSPMGQPGSVMISGSGFGAMASAQPLLWDDFEGQLDGASIKPNPQVGSWSPAGNLTKYSSTQAHSGGISLFADRNNSSFGNFSVSLPGQSMFYASFWFRYHLQPGDTGEFEMFRITGSCGGTCVGATQNDFNPGLLSGAVITGVDEWWSSYLPLEVTGLYRRASFSKPAQDTWHRFEAILKQSSPNLDDGVVILKMDGQVYFNEPAIRTRDLATSRWTEMIYSSALYNFTGPNQTWLDDVYLSNSWSRVEIGNDPFYAACTHLELQMTGVWVDNSISIPSLRKGSFNSGQTVYVFVVDDKGQVNSQGYPLVLP